LKAERSIRFTFLLSCFPDSSLLWITQRVVAGTVSDAKNNSIFVVRIRRRPRRIYVPELEGKREDALPRGRTGRGEGRGDDGGLRAGWMHMVMQMKKLDLAKLQAAYEGK
jgi:hypothetical protein